MSSFEYNKICRLCLSHANTYILSVFNGEYNVIDKINDLLNIEVYPTDPFPKSVCTDCFSNLLIFSEFKSICKNSEALLKKFQINKTENDNTENAGNAKGNGKCKSIRNSEEMANRIKDCALKKSMTFVENMKSFYFLLNHIEELDSSGVIIKEESLIPNVEISIKNEVIYPNDDNHQQMGSVIQDNTDSKRKKRKNNKRKSVNINGQNMEIDESGNIVNRPSQQQQIQQQHHPNIHIGGLNDNMALMLTVKQATENQHHHQMQHSQHHHSQIQIHSNTPLPSISNAPVTTSHQSISAATSQTINIIPQITYSCTTCTDTFHTTDSLRQHLFQNHQILFPFPPTTEIQYQHLPQSQSNIPQTTIQQQSYFPHHKKYFESDIPCLLCKAVLKTQEDLIQHMIKHTTPAHEREPTDLSTVTSQYK